MAKNEPTSATSGFGKQELLLPQATLSEQYHSTPRPLSVEPAQVDTESYDWTSESDTYAYLNERYRVYLGPLPYHVNSQTLGNRFQVVGTVDMAEVIHNLKTFGRTGQSLGLGYVKYTNAEDANRAMKMFNEFEWDGRIVRAFKDGPNVIYVGNLSSRVDDDRLHTLFAEYGNVLNARVMCNAETGQSLGYGFVVMEPGVSKMNRAILELDGQNLDGMTIAVNFSQEGPCWRHFKYDENEVESDEGMWKMYNRWQRHFNVKRSQDEQQRLFCIFKERAHYIHNFNMQQNMHKVAFFMYDDMNGERGCGREIEHKSFPDEDVWRPVERDSLEELRKIIKEKGWIKKKDSVAAANVHEPFRFPENVPLLFG